MKYKYTKKKHTETFAISGNWEDKENLIKYRDYFTSLIEKGNDRKILILRAIKNNFSSAINTLLTVELDKVQKLLDKHNSFKNFIIKSIVKLEDQNECK